MQFLLLVFGIYDVVWSYISIERYLGLHAYVYDVGTFELNLWVTFHLSQSPFPIVPLLFYKGWGFLLAPLWIPQNVFFLFVVQTMVLGACVFPLYGIGRMILGRRPLTLFIASTWLITPDIAGLNWFDLHEEAFFPLIFLAGAYLLYRSRPVASLTVLVLSGWTRFSMSIFPTILGLLIVVGESAVLLRRPGGRSSGTILRGWNSLLGLLSRLTPRPPLEGRWGHRPGSMLTYGIVLLSAGTALSLAALWSLPYVTGGASIALITHSSTSLSWTYDTPVKLFTIFLLFGSVLFLPVLSPRWGPLTVPFVVYVWTANFFGYEYPTFFSAQYGAFIAPFLYLGAIDGAHVLLGWRARRKTEKSLTASSEMSSESRSGPSPRGPSGLREYLPTRSNLRVLARSDRGRIAVIWACAALALALCFEPYSPLTGMLPGVLPNPFATTEDPFATEPTFEQLEKVVSFIPSNDPGVIVQNDLPEAYPRPFPTAAPLVPGGLDEVTCNLTHRDLSGAWVSLLVNYSISSAFTNAQGQFFNQGAAPYNCSSYDIDRILVSERDFGVLAEANGVDLLERGYSGPPQYFVPVYEHFPAGFFGMFTSAPPSFPPEGGPPSPPTPQFPAYWSPYVTLQPGTYRLSLNLSTGTPADDGDLNLSIIAGGGDALLGWMRLHNSQFEPGSQYHEFSDIITVDSFYRSLELQWNATEWHGVLGLGAVQLHQIANFSVTSTSQDSDLPDGSAALPLSADPGSLPQVAAEPLPPSPQTEPLPSRP